MIGYYTSKISDNIGRTPEGFLVCRDAVIGRTGFHTYKGEELLREHGKDKLHELGFDDVSPAADIKVFRDASEVFHPDTIRSFEGKPFTDNHPPGFLTPDNVALYQKGHIQNVRKGDEPLDSGDWPLVADIVVTDANLASRIENGERELSSGYGYSLKANNGTLWQTDIVGNHEALVPKGRAGSDARIYDAAPADAEAQPKPVIPPTQKRYKMKNPFKHLLGLGVRAMAADASTDPEDLAEAVKEASKLELVPPSGNREGGGESREDVDTRRRARAADAEPDMDDHAKRMHAALDHVLSKKAADMHSKDVDIENLKGLMSQYFNEEGKEPQHGADNAGCDDAAAAQGDVTDPATFGTAGISEDEASPGKEDEKDDEKQEREGKVGDARAADAVPTFSSSERRRPSAFAADAVGGAAFVLKSLKPHIAKACQLAGTNSPAARHLRRAFDTVATSVNVTARRTGTGDGYKLFAGAANERGEDAKRSIAEGGRARAADAQAADADTPGSLSEARIKKLNEQMKSRFRVSIQEVK